MTRTNTITVLFFLRRIGPYHHARFQAASKVLNLVAIETRPQSQEYPWQFEAAGNYTIERFPVSGEIEKGIRGSTLRVVVGRMFDKYGPDVVVTTGWADPEYHAVVLEASRRTVPRVVISDSRYESEPRKFYKEFLKTIILKSYSSALVAGTISKAYLKRLDFDMTAVFMPWDVVDNSYFSSSARVNLLPLSDRYFLCISRFIPEKNISRLIQAFGIYIKKGGNRKLVLAGSGELEAEIREQIRVETLTDHIDLTGFVQYDKLPKYMAEALCVILPSISDTWGLVVNEAMASGLPVLVSKNCGCAPDLVMEKKNGYIFDPHDTGTMAALMTDMDTMSEEAWRKMGEASKAIITNWDLDDFANGLLNACSRALEYPSKKIVKPVHILLSK